MAMESQLQVQDVLAEFKLLPVDLESSQPVGAMAAAAASQVEQPAAEEPEQQVQVSQPDS